MSTPGPLLEHLLRRLAETPPDILAAPAVGNTAGVEAGAVVGDVLRTLGLLNAWFRGKANPAAAQNWLYGNSIGEMAALAQAEAFVKDDERREELARLCLKALDFIPQGESEVQAQDRLESISSVERKRLIEASHHVQEAARKRRALEEERARKVREEMERKAAEAAAAKGTRE